MCFLVVWLLFSIASRKVCICFWEYVVGWISAEFVMLFCLCLVCWKASVRLWFSSLQGF
jgi:hypothetical protein